MSAAEADEPELYAEDGTQQRPMTSTERVQAHTLRGKYPNWTEGEVAQEMQRRSRMTYKQNRSVAQAERKAAFEGTVDKVSDRLAETSDDANFARRDTSKLCKMVVKQMADLIEQQILVPTTAKEAAEIAKVFSNIDQQERISKSVAKATSSGAIDANSFDGLPPDSKRNLLELVQRSRARAAQPVVPGTSHQVGEVDL